MVVQEVAPVDDADGEVIDGSEHSLCVLVAREGLLEERAAACDFKVGAFWVIQRIVNRCGVGISAERVLARNGRLLLS
jgi:hypothetical protein